MAKFRLLLCAAIACLSLTACGDSGKPAGDEAASAKREEFTVVVRDIPERRSFAGIVSAEYVVQVRARTPGTLIKVLVREGDTVKAGAVLAQVEDRRLNAEAAAAAAGVVAAGGEAERAAAEMSRTQELFDQGIYSLARLQQDKARADAAAGGLAAARARQAAAAEAVAQGAIVAPADGRVLRADLPVGAVITPGQAVLTVTAGAPLVRVDVPEAQAKTIRSGAAATVGSGAGAGTGRVERVFAESVAGSVRVDVSAPGLEGAITGEKVPVMLDIGGRPALVIPARFVRTQFGLDVVALRSAKTPPAPIAVQLAPGPTADEREVLSGLSAGDVIVAPEAGR